MARKKQNKEIVLGNKVKDKVTGFTGITTSKVEYLNGCLQFGVKPNMSADGKMPDTHYIDIDQLEYVGEGVSIEQKPTGGEMEDAPNSSNSCFH